MDRLVRQLVIPVCLTVLLCQDVRTAAVKSVTSFSSSQARSLKQAFGFSEDNYLTFQELTAKYEFPSEKHKVVTDDGYILTVFRILPKCDGLPKKYPVLLAHGMFDSSDTWIISGPKAALGYILSSNCYDVWITNRRGNSYSRKHVSLDPDADNEYWNFSFDENGNYDLPAVIDHMLNETQKDKVNFIGHSQGTTDFLVMLSLRPEYNKKVEFATMLAPIAWLKNLYSPFIKIAAPSTKSIKQIFDVLGIGELFGRYQLYHVALELLCNIAPGHICGTSLYLTTGSRELVSYKRLPVIFGHILDGISSKGMAHFGQLIQTKSFQRYDEGKEGNLERYGRPDPPRYNVSQITTPMLLVGSRNDWLSSLNDIDYLSSKLPQVLEKYIIPDKQWSHNDHVWADSAPKKLYPKILYYLNKFNA